MNKRILAVDDVESNRKLVSLILGNHGYDVTAADNGVDAIVLARSESPDLIVLDVMMPQLDGWEVRNRLRSDEATATIPIVFLSALGEGDIDESQLDPGLETYLVKPFTPTQLVEIVGRTLGL
jgi:CheY-like chemotaxis protein